MINNCEPINLLFYSSTEKWNKNIGKDNIWACLNSKIKQCLTRLIFLSDNNKWIHEQNVALSLKFHHYIIKLLDKIENVVKIRYNVILWKDEIRQKKKKFSNPHPQKKPHQKTNQNSKSVNV